LRSCRVHLYLPSLPTRRSSDLFTALMTFLGVRAAGVGSGSILLLAMVIVAIFAVAALGMLIARYLVLPLRTAPALNTLLITLMRSEEHTSELQSPDHLVCRLLL